MRKFFIAAAVAAAALLGSSSSAHATFQIRVSTDGGATFGAAVTGTETPGGGGTFGSVSTTVGAFNVTGSANNFVSTGLTLFDLQVSGIAAPGTYNLVIQASFNGITTAPAQQSLFSTFGASSLSNTPPPSLTATAETWVANGTALFQTQLPGPPISPIVADTGTLNLNDTASKTFSATVPYTATMQVKIVGTSLAPSSLSIDINNSINPAPAPAGLVLALAGMPVFGLGAYIRRRRAVKA